MAAVSDYKGMYKVDSGKTEVEVKEKTHHLIGIREFIYQGLEVGNLFLVEEIIFYVGNNYMWIKHVSVFSFTPFFSDVTCQPAL